MTAQDNERYVTAEQAADVLGTSPRTVHRYGDNGQLRTRKVSRRTMFHLGDVEALAEELQTQRRGPDPDELARLREQLLAAGHRIGYLEAQLEQRLLPDHAQHLRDELVSARAERDELRRRLEEMRAALERVSAPWRAWLLVALLVVIAVLLTLLVIGAR